MKRLLVLVIVSLAAVPAFGGNAMAGKVVGLTDGDTISLLVAEGQKPVSVRLAQIDAPETAKGKKKPGQPFGREAQSLLGSLVHGQQVVVEVEKASDRYGRVVGAIKIGETDVNRMLVAAGMAFVFDDYVTDQSMYLAEVGAFSGRKGVWSQCRRSESYSECRERLEKPWQFRQRSRKAAGK